MKKIQSLFLIYNVALTLIRQYDSRHTENSSFWTGSHQYKKLCQWLQQLVNCVRIKKYIANRSKTGQYGCACSRFPKRRDAPLSDPLRRGIYVLFDVGGGYLDTMELPVSEHSPLSHQMRIVVIAWVLTEPAKQSTVIGGFFKHDF